MTLYELIEAAIQERLAVAQAAASCAPPPWTYGIVSMKYDGLMDSRGGALLTFAHHYEPVVDVVTYLELNDPAQAVRDCTEDLDVLRRHAPVERVNSWGEYCKWCSGLNRIGWPYPCPETLSLARRYRIKVVEK